jgi:hypothetical protein
MIGAVVNTIPRIASPSVGAQPLTNAEVYTKIKNIPHTKNAASTDRPSFFP